MSLINPVALVGKLRDELVADRRSDVLCNWLCSEIPENASVLDVGCGDGYLARKVLMKRPDIRIQGIDVLMRTHTHVKVTMFDGENIPLEDNSVDVVTILDVLHHTHDPHILMKEAQRVARSNLIIKDHLRDGLFAEPTLRFMDWVGNAHNGVALPYNYWKRSQWGAAFEKLGLEIASWRDALHLYPLPFDWFFGQQLHFAARLNVCI